MAKYNKLEGNKLNSEDIPMVNIVVAEEEMLLKTPSKKESIHLDVKTPTTGSTEKWANALVVTPRRSGRKSQKPIFDYQEIICNSATKSLRSNPEQLNKFASGSEEDSSQQKWTVAEVGRDRHRRSRRSRNSKGRKTQPVKKENEDNKKLAEVELSPIKEEKQKQQTNENNEMPAVQDDEHHFHMLNEAHQEAQEESNKADNVDLVSPSTHVNNEGSMVNFGSHLKPSDAEMEDLGLITLLDDTENSIEINTDQKAKDDTMISLQLNDDSQINDNIIEISEGEDGDKQHQPSVATDIRSLPSNTNDHNESSDNISEMDSSTPIDASASETPVYTNANNIIQSATKSAAVLQAITESEVACTSYIHATGTATISESKGIVLRGIRKRSLSVCIGEWCSKTGRQILKESDSKPKTKKCVKFYSPANETTIIDDLDLQIAQNASYKFKSFSIKIEDSVQVGGDSMRQPKRSLSMDDICNKSRIPRPKCPVNYTPVKKQTASKELPSSKEKNVRSKLPNFAAIHERQFQKMENLIDYVNRKQERSKNLLNSNVKTSGSASKVCNPVTGTSVAKLNEMKKPVPQPNTDRPRSQKMLQMTSSTPKKLIATIKPMSCTKPSTKSHSSASLSKVSQKPISIKPTTCTKSPSKSNSSTSLVTVTQKPSKKSPPSASLATAAQKSSAIKPITCTKSSASAPMATASQKPSLKQCKLGNNDAVDNKTIKNPANDNATEDKAAERLQRHMDLFKGRSHSTNKSKDKDQREKESYIRGVRSNRRFELLMNHRRNMQK